MALFEQVEHADNILFYIDDNQIIFTDSTQGDNEVDLLVKSKILNLKNSVIHFKLPLDRWSNNHLYKVCKLSKLHKPSWQNS